jgi:DNA-binding XRE family transcriptional regulator
MHQPAPVTAKTPAFSRAYLGSPDQIRAVRGDLRGLLDGCPIADDAILCASELAANATLHSHSGLPGGKFTVRATLSPGDHVQVEVEDQGASWTPGARDPERGHGLDIIHALAADWGIDGDYRTRTVWARLDWPQDTPPPTHIPAGTGRRRSACDGGEPATEDPSPAPVLASARTTRPAEQWTAVLDGPRLRHLRRLHGLSQEKLADQAGISPATVARLERQARPSCRTRTMARLAAALGEHPATITRAITPAPRPLKTT